MSKERIRLGGGDTDATGAGRTKTCTVRRTEIPPRPLIDPVVADPTTEVK